MTTQAPWLAFYKDVPADMVTPDMTLYEMLAQSTARSPDSTAMYYLGRRMSYSDLKNEVDQAAAAFTAHGIRSRDSVILSLPNVPAVVIGFYALNKIGAYAVMTHPLSSIDELEHYISVTNARWAVTVDMFYPVFAQLAAQTGLEKVVLARIPEYASTVMKVGF
ncbi:MAG: AMP-binding protein, partial [Propionibacteriaceae bacterium]|nr:AMP-binding protein [Propionibacteriaceae bacterium]